MKVWIRLVLAFAGTGGITGILSSTAIRSTWLLVLLVVASVAALLIALVAPAETPTPEAPNPLLPARPTQTGIDLAWEVCTRMIDSQLDYVEKLDVKLGILIAGLIGGAGVYLDRAQGLVAVVLGCVALLALVSAVLGFLIGGYQDAPDPHEAIRSSDAAVGLTKAGLLDTLAASFDANQLIIYNKGRLLHAAAIVTSAVVVVAVIAKASSLALDYKTKASPVATPIATTHRGISPSPRIGHTLPHKD